MALVVDGDGKIFENRREEKKDRRKKKEKVEVDNRSGERRTQKQKIKKK